MVYENFLEYIEVDEAGTQVEVSENKVFYRPATRIQDAYVYKYKGDDHFGDFIHNVDFDESDEDYTMHSGILGIWGVTNTVDDFNHWTEGVQVYAQKAQPVMHIYCIDKKTGIWARWTGGVLNRRYYLIIERSGTSFTCKIYDDAEYKTLLHTLEIECQDTKYKYIYAGGSRDTDDLSFPFYGNIYNLDLNEYVPPAPKVRYRGSGWGIEYPEREPRYGSRGQNLVHKQKPVHASMRRSNVPHKAKPIHRSKKRR